MTPEQEDLCSAFLLRLLLEDASRVEKPDEIRWDDLLRIAKRNAVLVRLADGLKRGGGRPPGFFTAAVEEERKLNRVKLDLIRHVGRLCEENGVEFIFAKAFHHYPDMGSDVDLFVTGRSAEADARVLKELRARPQRRSLIDRLAATTRYGVRGYESSLEIHHGRMWAYAEHHSFIATLIENARPTEIEGAKFRVPSPEDMLVIQGTQRVYGRSYIRLAPVVYTISSLRRDSLDWGHVLTTARRFGALMGLSCYLSYVNKIHLQVFGTELLPMDLKESLIMRGWGDAQFKDGVYRFPHLRVARKIYMNMLRTAMLSRNWKSLGRLCLAPLVAATVVLRKSASQ